MLDDEQHHIHPNQQKRQPDSPKEYGLSLFQGEVGKIEMLLRSRPDNVQHIEPVTLFPFNLDVRAANHIHDAACMMAARKAI